MEGRISNEFRIRKSVLKNAVFMRLPCTFLEGGMVFDGELM